MSIPDPFAQRIARFPEVLRVMLEAELAAGNEIAELSGGFPAPPVGDCVKLARPITTRAHAKTEQVDYYDRDSSTYSGEWTDAKRFFFILEPPHPPEPEPDMDAIRKRLEVTASPPRPAAFSRRQVRVERTVATKKPATPPRVLSAAPSSIVDRFQSSMIIDYEKWHDGTGYDLALLKGASPTELEAIEEILLARGPLDWRDIEALAYLNTPDAKQALQAALVSGTAEIRAAVIRHAPALVSDHDKTESLLKALRTAEFYGGLSQALDLVAEFHPPEVIAELFWGALERKGEVAVHFAAMLMFVHGKASEPFDWDQRPFFLRFDAATHAEREEVFCELCATIGVDAATYLAAKQVSQGH